MGSVTSKAAWELPCGVREVDPVKRDEDRGRETEREHQGGKTLRMRPVEHVEGTQHRSTEEQDHERHQSLRHGESVTETDLAGYSG